jgi:hypothetical protein
MFGLKLFSRTSNRRRINLASFHSPHSLTWSWVLSLALSRVGSIKPYASLKLRDTFVPGFHLGLGQLIGVTAYKANNGLQWSISLLWVSLSWSRQAAMYYRDMHGRAAMTRDRLESENRGLRHELDMLRHNAARANPQTVPNHLH